MDAIRPGRAVRPDEPSFAELFTPKLVTVLREGYGLKDIRADIVAGLTVAIVALPLSMAIAIAAGATPDRGLYTAIVGGFVISALGGSRFQIGGPAGAFIVLVATCIGQHGIEGMLLATAMAGLFMLAIGFLRLGTYIKFIPYPVTVGFTAGIAVIILASQLKEFLGLVLTGPEPGPFVPKVMALWAALPTASPAAIGVALLALGIIVGLKRLRPAWPGMLVALVVAAVLSWLLSLPVETIASRYGGIPRTLPLPVLPPLSLELAVAVLPDAVAFALLGSIESLLSAVVADGMTGRRHRSNCELVAQGMANIASSLFGGLPATGTIARTATNVRAGARGPVAGMLHALFILLFMLLAAPLAGYVPLPALAAILVFVAWNMAEKHALATLVRSSRGDALVLLATFLLTVFRDLTEGIVVGFLIGAVLFIDRMAAAITVEGQGSLAVRDQPDKADGERQSYDPGLAADPDIVVYRIGGAFFFGAASTVAAALDRIADRHKAFILDLAAVPFLDSTAANTIAGLGQKAARHGVQLLITGATPRIRYTLLTHGLRAPHVRYMRSVEDAVRAVRGRAESGDGAVPSPTRAAEA